MYACEVSGNTMITAESYARGRALMSDMYLESKPVPPGGSATSVVILVESSTVKAEEATRRGRNWPLMATFS